MRATRELQHVRRSTARALAASRTMPASIGRFEPLRIAERADRQRGARELQQPRQARGIAPIVHHRDRRAQSRLRAVTDRRTRGYARRDCSRSCVDGRPPCAWPRVGARFGLERRLDRERRARRARAASARARGRPRCRRQPSPTSHRHVAVAEVIGGARERLRRVALDVQQRARAARPPRPRGRRWRAAGRRRAAPRRAAADSATSSPRSSRARRRLFWRSSKGSSSRSRGRRVRPCGALRSVRRDLACIRRGSSAAPAAAPSPARR